MSAKVARNFASSVRRLQSNFPISSRPQNWNATVDSSTRNNAAYCLIDLNDIWGHFCRELVIDNASGSAIDLAGNLIVPNVPRNRAQVLSQVINNYGHEPRWHDATKTTRAERKCKTNKSTQIQSALFVTSSPAPFINCIRNYFCHRRSDCRTKLQNHGGYRQVMDLDPYKIGNYLRNDGRRNIEFWIDELILIAFACAA